MREATTTTSGPSLWIQRLTATRLGINPATMAGIGFGVLFVAGMFSLAGLNRDETGATSPSTGASGLDHFDRSSPDNTGSRGRFADGGLFASEAPKQRSRAAGAAGKQAALAQQAAGQSTLSTEDGQIGGVPAGPSADVRADLRQLGPTDADVSDDEAVKVPVGAMVSGENTVTSTTGVDPNEGTSTTLGSTLRTTPSTRRPTMGSIIIDYQTTTTRSLTTTTPSPSPPPTRSTTLPSAPTTSPTWPSTSPSAPPTSPTSSSPTSSSPTSSVPTTGHPGDGTPLIVSPADGSTYRPTANVTFAAKLVAEADEYCWTFSGTGISPFTRCDDGTSYALRLRDHEFELGPVTVTGKAKRGATTLETDSVTISLFLDRVFNKPKDGNHQSLGQMMRIGFRTVAGATEYCYRLRQSGYDSTRRCMTGNGISIGRNDPVWDHLHSGPLHVEGRVLIGERVVGSQTVTVTLTE